LLRKSIVWLCLATSLSLADDVAEPRALTLTRAAELVLQQNPALRAAPFEREAAATLLTDAKRSQPWSVSLEVEDVLGTGPFTGMDGSQTTLQLSKILRPESVRSGQAAVAMATGDRLETELEARRLDLLAGLAQRYIDVAYQQAVLRLAAESVDVWQSAHRLVLERERAGAVPAVDRMRTEIRVANAELGLEGTGHRLESARMQLASTWGGAPDEFGDVSASLCELPDLPPYAALVAQIENNPHLLRFATEQRLREAEARLARSRQRPEWTLSAGVRHVEAIGEQAVVFSASIPLGTRARAASAIRRAENLGAASSLDREAESVRLRATLFDLYHELRHTAHEVEMFDETILPRARAIRTDIESGYRVGRFSHTALVNAQTELLNAASARLEACANHHRLLVDIERLIGGEAASADADHGVSP
jgi:cobalt-zinc-cadmium efflux system outer membrane protein